MNEGVGSTTILVIIVVFIAFASAYMAYNVNYTKAFRMKNKIISLYEEYNGECNSECASKIEDYAKEIGYSALAVNDSVCSNNPFVPRESSVEISKKRGYCEYKVYEKKSEGSFVFEDSNSVPGYYYRILTRIDIRIPIVQNVLELQALNITGDTKVFHNNDN